MENLRDRLRAKYASLILDIAESLPTFSGGIVSIFQEKRKYQRESSKEDTDRSRVPDGVQVKLHSFTLLRLYLLEDIERLMASLERLFPASALGWAREIIGDSDSLRGLSWSYIGHIVAKRTMLFPGAVAIFPDLPSEIEHIGMEVHRVLPSLLALTFKVTLADDVSTRLARLYKRSYLSEIRFNSWLPLGSRRWGSSDLHAESIRERTIRDYVDVTRTTAERFVARYTPRPSNSGVPGFVSVDQFRLASEKEKAPDLRNMAAWSRQFGFSWNYNSFLSQNNAMFLVAGKWGRFEYPHRFVIAADPPQGDIANSGIENTIHELIPFLAIHQVLSDSEDLVGQLRFQVFRRIATRGLNAWLRNKVPGSFGRDVRLNSRLQLSRMLLARLRLEYEQHTGALRSRHSGLREFTRVDEPKATLLDFFQGVVSREFDVVSRHLQLAAESFSLHVSLRNIDVTFRLSRWVAWLTLAVTAMTGLGLLANWPATSSGFKSLIGIFHR
ncbi:MAG: hypothetical protein WBV69_02780 [Candidatus Sulfotelmatobacter sp.]